MSDDKSITFEIAGVETTLDEEGMRQMFGDEAVKMLDLLAAMDSNSDLESLREMAGLDKSSDFIGANLAGSNLGCDLEDYNFRRADLRGASFVGATNLTEVLSFKDANITGAYVTQEQYDYMKQAGAVGQPMIRPAGKAQSQDPLLPGF